MSQQSVVLREKEKRERGERKRREKEKRERERKRRESLFKSNTLHRLHIRWQYTSLAARRISIDLGLYAINRLIMH